ncbi:MAG: hypothetical protein AAFX50_05725, partial [Acidobacteriota bacterium]
MPRHRPTPPPAARARVRRLPAPPIATLALGGSLIVWVLLVLTPAIAGAGTVPVGTLPGDPAACPLTLIAEEGMPIPGGGALFQTNSAGVNGRGEVVFAARIAGDPRDEAILVADADGLRVIARGCGGVGGGLGCGDPTPLGGTYASF